MAIGWAILGTGGIAARFAAALAIVADARLVAVVSRDAARASNFARRTGNPLALTDYDAALARDDVAVVYIATPNHRHKADCLRAIAAGKAVLCEKPICLTAADAREVAAAASAAGVFCMEGLWTHFIPAVQEAERLITAGDIGMPLHLTASFGSAVPFDAAEAMFDPARGGGALLDRGVYPISLALRFMGSVEAVTGERILGPGGVDLAASAILRFTDDRLAAISVSLVANQANNLVIAGSAGRLTLHEHITCPALLSVQTNGPPATADGARMRLRTWLRGKAPVAMLRFIRGQRLRHMPYRGNGMAHEIEAVQRCLVAGTQQSPVVPLALSIATLEVIERIGLVLAGLDPAIHAGRPPQ